MTNRAWVTLATNDSYGLGALVLAHSLRRVGSTHPTVVLITPSVTDAMRERLSAVFTEVITVDVLDSRDAAHLALLQRPELGVTFTKIHCWSLTQYEKCVFLDADTLVVQNCDELFEREELSAAPDVGWPDCFNSGVFVYRPSSETFDALIKFAQERGSFDGGDQGLLNSFFSDWARGDINKHLPFLYNVTSAAFYSYLPALKHYGQNLKIIHFIGTAKPWLQQYNWESRSVDAPDHLREFLQLWWDLFVGQVHHRLDATMVKDVEVEAPPAIPPADVGQRYAPNLDPESEFPWHHPDAQVQEDFQANQHKLDMTQFYDPWQNYRGNIPPASNTEVSDDRQTLREYAWEYKPPQEETFHTWHQPSEHHHNETWHRNEPSHDHFQTHSHEHRDHNWGEHSHVQSHDQPSHHQPSHDHHQTHDHHGHWHQEHEAGPSFTSHEHSALSEHSGHNSHHEHDHHHEHGNPQYPHDHHNDHPTHHYHDHSRSEPPQHHEPPKDTPHQYVIHQDFSQTHVKHIVNHTPSITVHHVHVDYDKITPYNENKMEESRKDDNNEPVTVNGINGDASSDSGDHEDIRPRHPYDNYYLRHRAAIDCYGRKICTHEMPPTPSPSLSPYATPPESPLPEEDETEVDNQSGVAGNLARVVPGSGSQREAVDELTRRQGWEAGNIDYMGADSFDNIWAKISQTLSQPRTSPPKEPSPPKQPSPPKEPAPKQPSPPKEPQPEPKAEVQEKAPAETVVEAAGKETPVSSSVEAAAAPTPVEAPAPVSAEAPAPVEAPVQTEAPAAVEAPAPAVAPAPAEAPIAVEAPVAAKAPVPTEAPAVTEAPAPVEAAAPAEAPVPVEALAPVETPKPETPVEAPVSEAPVSKAPAPEVAASAPAALETAAPKPPKKESKKTEKTEVPPTPPATPKSTPVSQVPPLVEALLEQAPVPTVEPSSPAAAEVPASPVTPQSTPEQSLDTTAASTDSPPLANTPSKEQAPAVPAGKSEERERKKPAGKLQLSPPAAADPLATPESELEDAAALAQSIIASELAPQLPDPTPPTPASSAAPATPAADARLSVEEPEVPTPPVGAVSLAQIGVKPKGKSTTAAQIESSVTEPTAETPATPTTPTTPEAASAPKDAPKKKVVKKVVKKEGDTPVPPPRKKEKKPKDK